MVQIDQLEYGKTAILEDRTETCPKCGKTSTYSTEDYCIRANHFLEIESVVIKY
ncbi:MAG TPA: hypothetical protein VN239_04075 [Nitrososphaera sp.]|nr:hypothetical protein [Nitrososphaera sp.]